MRILDDVTEARARKLDKSVLAGIDDKTCK